jgi:hypothetical protein
VLIGPDGDTGGIASEAEADVTYLGGEPTIHAFSPEKVEQATRFEYRADESGVVFGVLAAGDQQFDPALINTVARQLAAVINTDRAQPGVVDMEETQQVSALGSIDDVWQVAVSSTNGLTTQVYQLDPLNLRPDLFAPIVAAWRKQLDAFGT